MAKKSVKKSSKPKHKAKLDKPSKGSTPKAKAREILPNKAPRFYEESEEYSKAAKSTLRLLAKLSKSYPKIKLPNDLDEKIWKRGGADYLNTTLVDFMLNLGTEAKKPPSKKARSRKANATGGGT